MLVVTAALVSAVVLLLFNLYTRIVYQAAWYRNSTNRAAAPGNPEIDPPRLSVLFNTDQHDPTHSYAVWRPIYDSRVLTGLKQAFVWLIDYPRFSAVPDVLMILHVALLLVLPSAEILNNMAGRVLALAWGDSRGTPSIKLLKEALRAPFTWPQHLLQGVSMPVNRDHSLALYLQAPTLQVPQDILDAFAVGKNDMRANALVMSRMATLAYDRNHTMDDTLRQAGLAAAGFKFVCGWNFDNILVAPDDGGLLVDAFANTDVTLLCGPRNTLILCFRGTAPLSPINWLTDFVDAQPPKEYPGLQGERWKYGAYHGGFRHALGLDTNLGPEVDGRITTQYLLTVNAGRVERQIAKGKSPFAIIRQKLVELGTGYKLFVTGHSLGGALSNLFTAALLVPAANNSPQADGWDRWMLTEGFEAVHTFGQPRVGSYKYTNFLEGALNTPQLPSNGRTEKVHVCAAHGGNQAIEMEAAGSAPPRVRYVRMVNTNDVVARVPAAVNQYYQHPGHLVFLKAPPLERPFGRAPRGPPPLVWLKEQPSIAWTGTVWDGFKKVMYMTRCFLSPDPGAGRPKALLIELLPLWIALPGVLIGLAGLVLAVELGLMLLLPPLGWLLLPGVAVDAAVLLPLACTLSTGLPFGLVDHSMALYSHAILASTEQDWTVLTEGKDQPLGAVAAVVSILAIPPVMAFIAVAGVAAVPVVGLVLFLQVLGTIWTIIMANLPGAPKVPGMDRAKRAVRGHPTVRAALEGKIQQISAKQVSVNANTSWRGGL